MSVLTVQQCLENLLTQTQTLFCRLTVDTTKENLLEQLHTKYTHVIVSEEEGNRQHFHLLLLHTDTNSKNARQNLRNFLKDKYPSLKGNGDYAITQTHEGTTTRLAAYTIKEGNYVQVGFPSEYIEKIKKLSYKKFDGKKILDKMNELDEKWYMDKHSTIETWLKHYLLIKVEYNQTINPRTILPMMHLREAKKFGIDAIFARTMAEYNRV